MSTSDVSLLQIPEIPMKNILEYLDFPSILVLRKVCHDLRNFIDDTKPASHLTEIFVKVYSESIRFSMYYDQSIATGDLIRIETEIDYEKNGDGCLVRKFDDEENKEIKKTKVEDEDFVTLFCNDFNIVLRHQKTELRYFEWVLNSPNSTVKARLMESVNKSLKSMNHPLQVNSLYMEVNNHNDILSILPYVDPKPLVYIHISEFETKENDNSVLKLDEIGQLEQWKQAGELVITEFQLPDLAQNIKNCSSIFLGYRNISIQELILLKEIFLCSSTLTRIEMHYNFYFDGVIKPKLIETFGQPFADNEQDDSWFFRIPDASQFLRIRYAKRSIHLNRIEQSDVPQNAIISN